MGAISAHRLRKTYGDLTAVDDVDLEVDDGEFVGVLGPNGAGKTTLLELIEGLREADGGSVTIFGEAVRPRRAALQRRIGVQLQASSFFERLTAREQLHTFAALYGVARRSADAWLERVGLAEKSGTRVEDLSGGQAQRLSIACALVHDPELVFLDEPTAALDPQARRNLWDLLVDINEAGRTVVLTTHSMDEAETLCDRVAVMDHGRILRFDTPAALVRGLGAPTRVTLPPGALGVTEARSIGGVESVHDSANGTAILTRDPATTIAALAARGRLDHMTVHSGTLEDVFLALTGREYRA